jgi:hypothetical protein
LPAQFVPSTQQSALFACGTGTSAGFCTPDTIIEAAGEVQPTQCTAFAGVPESEGRCLSTCLKQVAQQPSLETSSCTAGAEKCVPCTNPITGEDTGACRSSSCDSPSKAPYQFPPCCHGNEGRCVPKSQVPSAQQGNLQTDSCSGDNYLCVPNENLPGGPGGRGCTAKILLIPYNGSCLSTCLNLSIAGASPQGDCPNDHVCVSCLFAKGQPGC